MENNLKDPKNPPTYRIHGYARRRLKKERSELELSLDRGWGNPTSTRNTLDTVNNLLSEPYGMVKFSLDKHKI